MSIRPVKRIVQSQPTMEGAGVRLRRAFGFGDPSEYDPFLMLDDFRNDRPEDYEAGFPWHPHRGIETITYVLAGTVDHADSLGNQGSLGAGDVQWMTAGRGILHQEMPHGDGQGRMHGFQLWANLPSVAEDDRPALPGRPGAEIPELVEDDGTVVRIICGEFWGRRGPVDGIAADPRYLDVSVPPGKRRTLKVEVARVGGDAVDGAAPAPELAADDPHHRAVIVDDLGDLGARDVLVARRRHLQRRRQVGPELEAVHPARRVAVRHLLVEDAAAGGHPLHVARTERALVAQAVGVVDRAGQHVGDGLDAAVRVPRKARLVVGRPVVAEVVQQQERVVLAGIAEAERAAQMDAGTFHGRLRLDDALDRTDRHGTSRGHRARQHVWAVDGRFQGRTGHRSGDTVLPGNESLVYETPMCEQIAMERIDECISFLAGKAAQTVSRLARERLAPFGVTPVQYAVLQVLWEQDGQSGAEIGARLVLDSATITGVLDRLESLGLIERTADRADRRVQRIRLTAAGRLRREPLQAVMDELNADVVRGFGAEAELLRRLLRRLATEPIAREV